MADLSLTATYARDRRTADRDELLRWKEETLAQPMSAAPAPAPAAEPKKPEEPKGVVAAGVSTAWDTFQHGARNIADAIYAKEPQGLGTSIGQGVLGALQIVSSLPAGAGAAVREAFKSYAPGQEGATAISGGPNSNAGLVRTMLGVPGLLLDPNVKKADPRAVVASLEEPMTYGELLDIITQFAVPAAMAKVARRGKAGEPTKAGEPSPAAPDVAPAAPAGPSAPISGGGAPAPAGGEIITLDTLKARAGVPGAVKPAGGEPAPSPHAPPKTMADLLAEKMGEVVPLTPEQVAAELRASLETTRSASRTPLDQPSRVARETPASGAPEIQSAPLKSAADLVLEKVPEPPGNLTTALDRAMARARQAVGEELGSEAGGVDPALLARMAVGAALGGTQGETPEERMLNAFLGLGLGAALSKRLAVKLKDAYKESGLADETGAIDFSKFRGKPAAQASEQGFQPNYQRLVLTPELARFSKNLHRVMRDEILERKGPPKGHEATTAAAEALIDEGKMTAERILTIEDTAVLSREEITAARMVAHRSRDYAWKLNESFKAGTISGQELLDGFSVSAALSKNVRVAQTRIAQAQEASRIKVGYERPSSYRPEDVIHLADDIGQHVTAEQLSRMLDSIERPAQRQKAVELAGILPRAFAELMYFSYLSGKAVLRNAIGGLIMPPVAMAEMALAPYMPRWGKAAQESRVLPGSATQMFIAYQESMLDMLRLLKVWDPSARKELAGLQEKVGGGRQLESRYAPAITSENFGGGAAVDFLGSVFRTPGNILGTTDAMSKVVNARMWQRFEAFHQASREGLAGEGFWKRMDDLMDEPTLLSDVARERVQDFAERQTFTKDFEGRMLGALQRGPEDPWLNSLYRWQVVPFFRTPLRATESGFTRTPGLNLLMKKFWDDMQAGGREQQIAQGRVAFGGLLIGTMAYLESQGFITGDGPTDPRLKKLWQDELGWQARSWWDPVSGKWRTYDGFAPVSDLIAAGADMSAAARRTKGDLSAAWLAGSVAMATAFDTKGYTRTLSEWFDFMRSGTSDDSKWEQFVTLQRKRIAGLVSPGALRELETIVDPEIRRARPSGAYAEGAPGSAIARELDVLKREWMSQIPGLSSAKDAEGNDLIPPDRDRIDGKPTVIETAPFNAFPGRTPKDDPLKRHIFAELQGAGLSPFPEWIGGQRPSADMGIGTRDEENVAAGVRMTPQEKDVFARLMTQEIRDGLGQTYRQALEAAVADPIYQAQPTIGPSGTPRDGGKASWLQRIDQEFHTLTEDHLTGMSPKLKAEVGRRQAERIVRKVPPAEQAGTRELIRSLTR